jgi:tRNA (guanine-N7-)-methyltransferase
MSDNPQSIILQPASYIQRLAVDELFSSRQSLEVELGAGDGSFLTAWAALNPTRNFLAVERLLGRMCKAERKARRADLKNVRLLRIEAAYFLEYLLPPASVAALHVYFPDPWPKRKHHRHRLINAHFAATAARALAPGGVIHLRTDDQSYFAQMRQVFAGNPAFEFVATPRELQSVLTDFERGFQKKGISTLSASYRLAPK